MIAAIYHPEAAQEATDAVDRYERERPGLGADFRRELDATIERITATPEFFGFLGDDIHCLRLHRFPYGVLYQAQPERIFIVAVMHLHRHPDYWKHRL